MRPPLLLLLLLVLVFSNTEAKDFYVSANANVSGDGSLANPWRFQDALNSPAEITNPSDTIWIWMLGGVYTNNFDVQSSFSCFTNGKANAPIIFKNYKKQRVTIDGQLTYTLACVLGKCSYTWFWGLEFTNSSTVDRVHPTEPRGGNIYCTAEEMKFINLVIHDMSSGLDLWKTAKNAESYGCIVYHIGNNKNNNGNYEGHGHGMYLQNDTVGTKIIHNNIVFSTFGYGLKVWQTTTTAPLGNFDFQRNIVFNGGAASENLGGLGNNTRTHNFFVVSNATGNPVTNSVFKHNYTYSGTNMPRPPVNAFGLNYGVKNFVLDSNYLTGQTRLGFNNTPIFEASIKGNKIVPGIPSQYGYFLWGFKDTDYPNNEYFYEEPTGLEYFLIPNSYEKGRFHVAVYNWDSLDKVQIDLSSIGLKNGDSYRLTNVMDYYHDIDTGKVGSNNSIDISMTQRSFVKPLGSDQEPFSQFPKFGAFVLEKTGHSGSSIVKETSPIPLNMFPNPSNGKLRIQATLNKIQDVSLQVYDCKGIQVEAQHFEYKILPEIGIELELKDVADGMYVIKLWTGQNTYQGKVQIIR